jgi:hypothetical protein
MSEKLTDEEVVALEAIGDELVGKALRIIEEYENAYGYQYSAQDFANDLQERVELAIKHLTNTHIDPEQQRERALEVLMPKKGSAW